ncbi:MAG: hypothetical protein GX034_06980, partial [Clostridiaceae bacterium]|nr:hypothetical protein [Clostridiaceae bacterium]
METAKSKIWNFFLNHSAADLPAADPEQESKILRYPPPELLHSNWYLNRNILTVQIDDRKLKALVDLDAKSLRKADLGLERLLSVVRSCERLEEELLSVEAMFLHPALIYFSTSAKILTLPFPAGIIAAGTPLSGLANPWVFSSIAAKDQNSSGLASLLDWLAENYSMDNQLVRELMPLCQQGDYRKIQLKLSGKAGADKNQVLAPAPEENQTEEANRLASSDKKQLELSEKLPHTDKQRKKTMNISADTNKIEENTPEVQARDKKRAGLFGGLRSRYPRDFQQSEKTADLVLEDP